MRLSLKNLVGAFLGLVSCQSKPIPIDISLADYTIHFPSTAGEICSQHPNAYESQAAYLVEETPQVQLDWRFSGFTNDARSQLYGVLMTLRNQSDKMDSITTTLEKRYNRSFISLYRPQYLGKYEYYPPDSTLSVLDVNNEVQLSIRRRVIWSATGPTNTDDVVIAISYGLNAEEKERFAMKQGDIYLRD